MHPTPIPVVSFSNLPKTVQLEERETGWQVEATCIPLTRENASARIDNLWWTHLPCSKDVMREETDRNWKWVTLRGELKSSKQSNYVRGWAVQVDGDPELQGAILYRTNTVSYHERSDGSRPPAVYCARLATAPRNRNSIMHPRLGRYRGVGTSLLRLAVAQSHFIGGAGRVNLEAVDQRHTIEMYRRFGFSEAGWSSRGTLYMELTAQAAERYLREMGLE